MSYVRFIDHQGRRVVLLDYTGVRGAAQWNAAVDATRDAITRLPADRSAFSLTDVTGTRFDRTTVEAFKTLTAQNRPYIQAGAVVSDSTVHRAVITMIGFFSKRTFEVFESRDRALAWLGDQPRPPVFREVR
jgi:hypothetical protein